MQFNPRVTGFKQYPFAVLAAKRKELQDAGRKVFDFSKGDPVEPTPSIIREAAEKSVPKISQYPAVKGLPELRAAVSKYLQRRFQVAVDPETQILQCNGSKEAIYNLTSVVIGPDSPKKVVIGASPGYPVVERSTVIFSGEPYPVQLLEKNNFLVDLAAIPEAVLKRTAMAWLNYPNNPTAASCTLDYFKRQIEIAKKYDILLCSDECYVDMYLDDNPHPSALQVTTEGVVVFQSCSKRSGMTGYRTGFIAGDKTLLKHYLSLRDAIGTETSVFVQQAAVAAWNDDKHVEERKAIFRAKRDLFLDFFAAEQMSWAPCAATFYVWLKTPKKLSGMQYYEALVKEGIIVTPGEFFGEGCKDRVRVALVPSLEQSKEAIALWKKCNASL
jgi:succinyldiaminopimelate transaminase